MLNSTEISLLPRNGWKCLSHCSHPAVHTASVVHQQVSCNLPAPWTFMKHHPGTSKRPTALSLLFPFATFSGIHSVPKHGLKLGEKWPCVKLGEKYICVFCTTDPVAWVTLENTCSRSSQPTKPTNSA